MLVKELEIIKAALEGDIFRQKHHENREHPAFREWLFDSEKLLKKVSRKLIEEKAKQHLLEQR